MTFVQRLFTSIVPKSWATDMEAESRSWMVRCSNCNYERSVWDMGGVRWKAAGNPRQGIPCSKWWQTTLQTF